MVSSGSYNVNATALEGIILKFKPHQQSDLHVFHYILNEAYGLSLYNSDINFVFDDVAENGLTKIRNDTPEQLQTYFIDNIKSVSRASTRGFTAKVNNLFGKL